jgi:hypothetical protein
MKRLCSAPSLPDAHILRELLEDAGIDARVLNENAQGGVGQLPVNEAYPQVWILKEADYERAREVVRSFERAPRDAGSVRCPRCGEDNPANFQLCWNCGNGL